MRTFAQKRFAHDFSRIPVRAKTPVTIQPKLAINTPGDVYEQEADHLAEQVMRMSEPRLQRTCACGGGCPSCETEQPIEARARLQTKRVGSGDSGQIEAPPIVHEVLASPGQPLDSATRDFMEPRFGHDFAQVRLHTNNRAAESAGAVNALAYTVGNHIVFGAGQHVPGSFGGHSLLAHELAHVVQQNGGQPLPDEVVGRQAILRAPIKLMSRPLGPASDEEEQKQEEAKEKAKQEEIKRAKKNEADRKAAIKRHIEQQHFIADFLDNARKLTPDPKRGLRDPDNLFHNTVELLDRGKLTLMILSPTHYSSLVHFDSRFRFDSQANPSTTFGGEYPEHPWVTDAGSVVDKSTASGMVAPPVTPPAPISIATVTPKVEGTPGGVAPVPASPPPPAPVFSPGDVRLFTRDLKITESDFKNTFVHEAQHVADLSSLKPKVNAGIDKLEQYKSEFRAFWIQPPHPRTGLLASEAIDSLPESKDKADNSRKVAIAKPQDCKVCAAPDPSAKSAYVTPDTAMNNARQEAIFWNIIANYKEQEYDCCYVFNQAFHEGVNKFDQPTSVNLINSNRLLELNLELQKLNSSMTISQVSGTNFVTLLTQLEPLDWAFLNDKLSAPFWEALNSNAPRPVQKAMTSLVKKGMRKQVTAADVNTALSGTRRP